MNVLDPTFLRDLNDFLAQAMANAYAGGGEHIGDAQVQRRPGFKELVYRDGLWSYRDSYTGFLTSAGQEVVWYNDLPVWTQSYAGGMLEDFRDPVLARTCFRFLKAALAAGEKHSAFQPRGPHHYEESDWHYNCQWSGDITGYHGDEEIFRPDEWKPIFFHRFFGGVIMHDTHDPQS